MILVPDANQAQLTNLDTLQTRSTSNILDTNTMLNTDALCADYSTDGLKVLNGLIWSQDGTTPDTVYYQ